MFEICHSSHHFEDMIIFGVCGSCMSTIRPFDEVKRKPLTEAEVNGIYQYEAEQARHQCRYECMKEGCPFYQIQPPERSQTPSEAYRLSH